MTGSIARFRFVLVFLVIAIAVTPAAAQCSLSGSWNGTWSDTLGSSGPVNLNFYNASATAFLMTETDIYQNANNHAVTLPGAVGTISGSSLMWILNYPNIPGGTLHGTASISADCNTITGTETLSFATDVSSFTATRSAVTLSLPQLTFQSAAVGLSTSAQTLTLTNGSSGVARLGLVANAAGSLNLGPPTTAGDFSATTTCGASLAPSASCSISVTCNPTAPGVRTGTLYVNDPNKSPLGSVPLTCSGVTPIPGASFVPESGWWWDSKLNGTGFFVEYGGNSGKGLFVGGFLYDSAGNSAWLVSTGPLGSATYTSTWLKVTGGQTLTGSYKAPNQTTVANVTVAFTDATHAVMTRPDGTQINLTRFSFSALPPNPPTAPVGGAPQSGWWWAGSNFSGTGYGIEIQGNAVFIVAYVYDNSGNPIWYLATGGLTNPSTYTGTWDIYGGGPQLTSPEGNYTAQKVPGTTVNMTLTFSDATHGTLTMGSVAIPIVRFQTY